MFDCNCVGDYVCKLCLEQQALQIVSRIEVRAIDLWIACLETQLREQHDAFEAERYLRMRR